MRKDKEVYDLIFSLGEACSCTQSLRKSKLQVFSYPLDWLFGTDFIGRCKLLASHFERFLEKEDLEYTYSVRSISCDAYYNKYNDLTFNHDFKMGVKLDDSFPEVKEKYTRRINRLLTKINKSKKVLIVYIEVPIKEHVVIPDETLLMGVDIIQNKFKNSNINLLYLSHSSSKNEVQKINDSVCRIQWNYKSKNKNDLDYVVDFDVLTDILKRYRLKKTLMFRIKKRLTRWFGLSTRNKRA